MRTTDGLSELRRHPFFSDIDFEALSRKALKVPGFDLFSTTTDSDDSLNILRRFSSDEFKGSHPLKRKSDISLPFDDCCLLRASTLTKIFWQGDVKVRRKFFLLKNRQMIVYEDGTLL